MIYDAATIDPSALFYHRNGSNPVGITTFVSSSNQAVIDFIFVSANFNWRIY